MFPVFAGYYRVITHKFTEAVTACTRPLQIQGRQNQSMDQEDAHEIKPLAIELCVIDGCSGIENHFLSGMCSLCSNRLSCIHAHRESTRQTQWVLKEYYSSVKKHEIVRFADKHRTSKEHIQWDNPVPERQTPPILSHLLFFVPNLQM